MSRVLVVCASCNTLCCVTDYSRNKGKLKRCVISFNSFLSPRQCTYRRRALHKFDPADLKNADVHKHTDPLVAAMASTFAATAVVGRGGEKEGASTGQIDGGGVQARQIADAATSGLLVDFGAASATTTAATAQGLHEQEEERYQEMIQEAEEEGTDDLVAFAGKSAGDYILDDVDSDDDLL